MKKLIRRYQTLCTKIGMSKEARKAMLQDNYGVESSTQLQRDELQALCKKLEFGLRKQEKKASGSEINEARLRLLAAVYKDLEKRGYKNKDFKYAEAEILRMVKKECPEATKLNDIPINVLRKRYAAMGKKNFPDMPDNVRQLIFKSYRKENQN